MITPLVAAGVGFMGWRRVRSGGMLDRTPARPADEPAPRPLSAEAARATAELARHEAVADRFARRSLVLLVGTTAGALINPAFTVLTVPFLAVQVIPLFRLGYLELRDGKPGGGVVRALAGGGMLLTRAFWMLSLSGVLYGYIDQLQVRARRRAQRELAGVFGALPGTVRVRRGGADVEVALEALAVGDLVVVEAGQPVPADGRIEDGEARIDHRTLTGDAEPVDRTVGDGVLAAAVVRSGQIAVRVERTGAATAVASIEAGLYRAAEHAPAIARAAAAIADRSVAPTLALAALAQALLGSDASICMLSAYPGDGIRALASLAALRYLRHAVEHRIAIRDGRALEALPAIDVVALDSAAIVTERLARLAPDAVAALVAALRARGIALYLLCGAHPGETERIAGQLGVDHVVTGPLPEHRARQIQTWRAQGKRVCAVGDGVDGAAVLHAAEVSVSLAGAATITADTASVVLLDGDPARLPLVFGLAGDLAANLRHSLIAGLAPSPLLAAGIFLLGFRTPATLLLTSAGALAALANATRIAEHRLNALDHAPPAVSGDAEAEFGLALATTVQTVQRGVRRWLGALDRHVGVALQALGRVTDRMVVLDSES